MRHHRLWIALAVVAVVAVVVAMLLARRSRRVQDVLMRVGFGCPNVSGRVLPACELERRRPEAGRTYCPRGVCGPGLVAVPDDVTAYTICVPKGKSVAEACPY